MGKTTLVAFRLENELLRRVDAYAKRLEDQTPSLKLARADAVSHRAGARTDRSGRVGRLAQAARLEPGSRLGRDLAAHPVNALRKNLPFREVAGACFSPQRTARSPRRSPRNHFDVQKVNVTQPLSQDVSPGCQSGRRFLSEFCLLH
jgi:hypothetical protein